MRKDRRELHLWGHSRSYRCDNGCHLLWKAWLPDVVLVESAMPLLQYAEHLPLVDNFSFKIQFHGQTQMRLSLCGASSFTTSMVELLALLTQRHLPLSDFSVLTVPHHHIAMGPIPSARLAYWACQPRLSRPQTIDKFQPPRYVAQSQCTLQSWVNAS